MWEPSGPSRRTFKLSSVVGPGKGLVIGTRGFQLLGREQVGDVHQATVGQLPEARDPFVDGMVVFEVLSLEVFPALPPVVEPDEEGPDVVALRTFADHEAIALSGRRPRQSGPRWPASGYRPAWRRTATPGCARTRSARSWRKISMAFPEPVGKCRPPFPFSWRPWRARTTRWWCTAWTGWRATSTTYGSSCRS